jgi:hypothetical protein
MPVRSRSRSIAQAISRSKTIVWNGPAGVFEFDKFAGATKAMAAGHCRGHRQGRHHRRGRRRHRHGRQEVQGGRQGHPLLHRRRRQPRVPRRQGPARRGNSSNPESGARRPRTFHLGVVPRSARLLLQTPIPMILRKKLIAGNWKMNKTPSDGVALVHRDRRRHRQADRRRCRGVPAVHRSFEVRRQGARRLGREARAPRTCTSSRAAPSPARSPRRCCARSSRARHSRPQRAAQLFGEHGRLHQPEGASPRSRHQLQADPLRRRDPREREAGRR